MSQKKNKSHNRRIRMKNSGMKKIMTSKWKKTLKERCTMKSKKIKKTRIKVMIMMTNLTMSVRCLITNSGTKICKTWRTRRMKTTRMKAKRIARLTSVTESWTTITKWKRKTKNWLLVTMISKKIKTRKKNNNKLVITKTVKMMKYKRHLMMKMLTIRIMKKKMTKI